MSVSSPPASAAAEATVEDVAQVLAGRRVVALTGAGVSTESGIPDYRGPGTLRRARNPIQYREFVGCAEGRRRYWARSVIGWARFATAAPNAGHRALAAMEEASLLAGIITQNVDRLHDRAGSRQVVELHGALAEVRCLDCRALEPRDDLQRRLEALNPGWAARRAELAPDGDAELPADLVAGFRVADCARCDGVLKPNVVFFGESVPPTTVQAAWALLDDAEALLVVGSSLAVFSGFRFVRRAAQRQMPIAIVNLGPSRGDDLAAVRMAGRAGQVLPALADTLARGVA